jgi:hypothetical protein
MVSPMRLRGHVDLDHRDFHHIARLDHLMRVLDETSASWLTCTSPSWCTPISTKAPKAATLVTVPSSTMPGFRSDLVHPFGKGCGAKARARVAAGLFQLGQDVLHRGQAEFLVDEGGGFSCFSAAPSPIRLRMSRPQAATILRATS